jgi:hypothetical protein
MRYRERKPGDAPPARRRIDGVLAAGILIVETLVLATLWGPQPAGWLWIGSQVNYQTDNVAFGLLVSFAGMLATILGTLAIAMRLDRAWKLVRRAAGHDQKEGMLERIFVASMIVGGTAFAIWLLIIQGPSPTFSPTQ